MVFVMLARTWRAVQVTVASNEILRSALAYRVFAPHSAAVNRIVVWRRKSRAKVELELG
jgi:hypothetical protein